MSTCRAVPTLILLLATASAGILPAVSGCKSESEKASASAALPKGPAPILQFGSVAELYEKEDAREFEYADDTVLLRTVRNFGIQEARVCRDPNGYPAVLFVIADAEKEAFHRWTASLVGRQMALLVDGKVVAMPTVHAPLPGAGIVVDETRHWTDEEAKALAERINVRSQSPPN